MTNPTQTQAAAPVVPRLIKFTSTLPAPAGQATARTVGITFALYKDQQGGAPLWMETQNVSVDANGRYTALVGSQSQDGLPIELFTAGEARWLGVRPDGEDEKPRVLLVSVAYALKAADAETLGGKPLSSFVLVQGAQSPSTTVNSLSGTSATTAPATSSSTGPAQPATDFFDTNSTEVLLVTQFGDGLAINANSQAGSALRAHNSGAGDAATIRAENGNSSGTAIAGVAFATDGATTGVLGTVSSTDGTAGVFKNSAFNGKILSLQGSWGEVAFVTGSGVVVADGFSGRGHGLFDIPNSATTATSSNNPDTIVARDLYGGFAATHVHADAFSGNGVGLSNIPNSATTAISSNNPDTIVARDANGSFSANYIYGNAFFGSGRGLFDIPNWATTATNSNTPDTIVARDANGNFAANYIYGNTFFGGGEGLSNIPNSATTATSSNNPVTIVARDASGNFAANYIYANTFFGSGQGLSNIPNSATSATYAANADTIVARDLNGNFAANQVYANVFFGSGAGLSGVSAQNAQHAVSADTATDAGSLGGTPAPSFARLDAVNQFSAANTFAGNVDMSGASATLPVRAVLTIDTPAVCIPSKELLIKTDAPVGQQLFICNAGGNGWALVGGGAANNISFDQISGTLKDTQLPMFSGDVINATAPTRLSLSDTGVYAGTYTKVTVDSKGRAIAGDQASFAELSGNLAAAQMPALSGDVTSAPGTTTTSLSATGISAGTYTRITVDAKGRATAGAQASLADLSGSVAASQMPALTGDVTSAAGTTATSLSATGIPAGTYTKITVDSKGRATAGQQVSFSDVAGTLSPGQLPSGVAYTNINNAWTGDQVITGNLTAATFSGNGSGITYVNAAALNGFSAANFAQVATVNAYTQKQIFAAATGSAGSLNLPPSTTTPASPAAGDVWNDGNTILFRDNASMTQSLVSTSQAGGMQLLKLTASITPASVAASACAEQTFTVSGITTGDVLLSVLQPQTASPGTNIAIGAFRVASANTVTIQFCNAGKSGSTPRAGTYIFALMR